MIKCQWTGHVVPKILTIEFVGNYRSSSKIEYYVINIFLINLA